MIAALSTFLCLCTTLYSTVWQNYQLYYLPYIYQFTNLPYIIFTNQIALSFMLLRITLSYIFVYLLIYDYTVVISGT